MIGKPTLLLQIPNQRLFGTKAAARYLGVHEQTLRKYADLKKLPARRLENRRVFLLEDLNRFCESLPRWYDDFDEESGTERSNDGDQY